MDNAMKCFGKGKYLKYKTGNSRMKTNNFY